MANIQYYDVILKPVITEKSMNAMAEKKYTFLVHPEANKSMIKEAVERMFEGTKVASVNTMNMDGKKKRRGVTVGKTASGGGGGGGGDPEASAGLSAGDRVSLFLQRDASAGVSSGKELRPVPGNPF